MSYGMKNRSAAASRWNSGPSFNSKNLPPSEPITWPEGCGFEEFKEISEKTIDSFKDRGFTKLMPVQCNTFRSMYDGESIIARDLTGSGKTLGFCLPLVESYRSQGLFETKSRKRNLLAIALAPTRELALQISKELEKLRHSDNEYRVLTVYGGVPI